MIKNYTEEEFNNAKYTDNLSMICEYCKNVFYVDKHRIIDAFSSNTNTQVKYCSYTCSHTAQSLRIKVSCSNCKKEIEKKLSQIKKSKSGNHFCTSSCSAMYNNNRKVKYNRRSKLEVYLEKELTTLYLNLNILFNDKNTINSELDIYIPSLNLAFELNGIFHYEPIYGDNKLSQIQNNDNRKFQACLEQRIELCIIDTSKQSYFKIQTSKKYLDIIINIINDKMASPTEYDSALQQ